MSIAENSNTENVFGSLTPKGKARHRIRALAEIYASEIIEGIGGEGKGSFIVTLPLSELQKICDASEGSIEVPEAVTYANERISIALRKKLEERSAAKEKEEASQNKKPFLSAEDTETNSIQFVATREALRNFAAGLINKWNQIPPLGPQSSKAIFIDAGAVKSISQRYGVMSVEECMEYVGSILQSRDNGATAELKPREVDDLKNTLDPDQDVERSEGVSIRPPFFPNADKGKHCTIRPEYYGGPANLYEPIKVIRAWELGFNLGNALKYIQRNGKKQGEDKKKELKKALTYIQFELDEIDMKEKIELAKK